MSLSIYEAALTDTGADVRLRSLDGVEQRLDVPRWSAAPDAADEQLLSRLRGPVLDVGCGPGRLCAALTARGVVALGLDLSAVAVELTRARGGVALQGDVYSAVPGAGTWQDVLLIDGNVGIGGEPVRLLSRTAELLAPQGVLHIEVGPPGGPTGSRHVRLVDAADAVGGWFRWGWVTETTIAEVAREAGLGVHDRWRCGDRWFVEVGA